MMIVLLLLVHDDTNDDEDYDDVCDEQKYRAQKKVVEKELRDLTVEHELRLQAFQKLQEERNELLKRQRESILDIQQRSGLKKILLQKKLAAVTETLEKKEAQLSTALSVCSIEPMARSNAVSKLEEILESKRISMDALQQDLDPECQEYEQLRHSWKEQLKASGGSLHDFPARKFRVYRRKASESYMSLAGVEKKGKQHVGEEYTQPQLVKLYKVKEEVGFTGDKNISRHVTSARYGGEHGVPPGARPGVGDLSRERLGAGLLLVGPGRPSQNERCEAIPQWAHHLPGGTVLFEGPVQRGLGGGRKVETSAADPRML
ncbi:hypothetical protein CRENBAI_007508 [Crenichthys baileyi]|uniref:Dynein regulatory complex subunit 4 n=1 Tax=Crenichthys baileyi TaxID=28760 RepID=A0AAV9QUQ2_9TELE